MVSDLVPATHSKFVLVFAVTVSPVCIQHFVTERDPFCDRVGSTLALEMSNVLVK